METILSECTKGDAIGVVDRGYTKNCMLYCVEAIMGLGHLRGRTGRSLGRRFSTQGERTLMFFTEPASQTRGFAMMCCKHTFAGFNRVPRQFGFITSVAGFGSVGPKKIICHHLS